MSNKTNSSSGIGLGTILFVVFLILKLTGNINWSWWWITAPLWLPVVLVGVVLSLISLFAIIYKTINK